MKSLPLFKTKYFYSFGGYVSKRKDIFPHENNRSYEIIKSYISEHINGVQLKFDATKLAYPAMPVLVHANNDKLFS